MERTGSEVIIQALREEGVDKVFGYPGGCVIPLFDAFYQNPDIQMVLVRHEQAASHAADGYARVSGKAAVVVTTSGPGATNAITGIATAAMDSIPMVIITGQVKLPLIGTDAFQEANVIGISRPCTKHNYLVKDINNLPRILKEAFYIAQSGRPGPVLIDLPVDLQVMRTSVPYPDKIDVRGYNPHPQVELSDIDAAMEMLQFATRPVIYAGGGVTLANASKELTEFAVQSGIPVTTTLLGIGNLPEDHKLSLGMLGMHGTFVANMAMTKADVVLSLGARFDDRVTGKVDEFVSQAKIIQVDIDPSIINKIIKVDIGIVANVKNALIEMNKRAKPMNTQPWIEELEKIKKKVPLPNFDKIDMLENNLRPEYVVNQLSKLTKGEAVIVSDVGQNQMFTAQHYTFRKPRSYLSSGGLGTMGYALPAAIGAAFYCKEQRVISISGDGGFQMTIQELATVRNYDLPLIMIILNNGNLGMVKQWQDLFWGKRHSSTVFEMNPDFMKIAEAYAIPAYSTGKKEEVSKIIKQALKEKGPVLLEFIIDKDAHVYPMIPAGARLTDIMLGGKKV